MNKQTKMKTIEKEPAESYLLRLPAHSYAIFCINQSGSLFMQSDWGFFASSWQNFGPEKFKEFIATIDAEYCYQKFDQNTRYLFDKGLPKHVKPHVVALLKSFQEELKIELEQEKLRTVDQLPE